MPYNPQKHHRRSIRLPGYDYTQPGMYYVTLRVDNRAWNTRQNPPARMAAIVNGGGVRLTRIGRIVARTWTWLSRHHPYVELDAWVIMPDHLHGIIVILDDDEMPTPVSKRKPLGRLVGAFKTVSTKALNQLWETSGARFWQRNYYEHIVRDMGDLGRIRAYIANNPRRWLEKQSDTYM